MKVFVFHYLFALGGLGFEFFLFVIGWRQALESDEWPFLIILLLMVIMITCVCWGGRFSPAPMRAFIVLFPSLNPTFTYRQVGPRVCECWALGFCQL